MASSIIRIAALAGLVAASVAAAQDDSRLARSRDLATELQQRLAARLMTAIGEGGPVKAIDVCNVEAPEIAAQVAAGTGAAVGRTSLRVRNQRNAPDDAARAMLERFEAQWQRDASAPPEAFAAAPDGSARYMRAIPTQGLCVVCHGPQLAPDVAAAIAARYPNDTATGFAIGTLRGAFLIDWPRPAE